MFECHVLEHTLLVVGTSALLLTTLDLRGRSHNGFLAHAADFFVLGKNDPVSIPVYLQVVFGV